MKQAAASVSESLNYSLNWFVQKQSFSRTQQRWNVKLHFFGLLICQFYFQIRSVIINQLFIYKNLTLPPALFLFLSLIVCSEKSSRRTRRRLIAAISPPDPQHTQMWCWPCFPLQHEKWMRTAADRRITCIFIAAELLKSDTSFTTKKDREDSEKWDVHVLWGQQTFTSAHSLSLQCH